MRFLILLIAALLLGMQPPATYTNPVVIPVAADPDVVRAPDGRFYLYATQDDWGDGGGSHLVQAFIIYTPLANDTRAWD
ncbi:MAG: hypothetical protein ACOYW9_07975 [Deinococcota bacterium]